MSVTDNPRPTCTRCHQREATVRDLCASCAHDDLVQVAELTDPTPSPIDLEHLSRLAAERQASYLRAVRIVKESQAARDAAVVAANDAGISYDRLAKILDVPKGTVQSIVRRHGGDGDDDAAGDDGEIDDGGGELPPNGERAIVLEPAPALLLPPPPEPPEDLTAARSAT